MSHHDHDDSKFKLSVKSILYVLSSIAVSVGIGMSVGNVAAFIITAGLLGLVGAIILFITDI